MLLKIVIPLLSLSPHGGTRVLIDMANNLVALGHEVAIVAGGLYASSVYPIDPRVYVELLPRQYGKISTYFSLVRKIPRLVLDGWCPVLNHALTFSSLLLPSKVIEKSVIVLQDMDWRGVRQPFGYFIKAGAVPTLRRHSAVIVANPYLDSEMVALGGTTSGVMRLGIAAEFVAGNEGNARQNRDIDFMFIGRPQARKRLGFYVDWYNALKTSSPEIRVVAVSRDKEVIDLLSTIDGLNVIEPADDKALQSLYARSKFFLLASSAEGFALPPLEAMGSGCVPIITACGGPDVYAKDGYNSFILPQEIPPHDAAMFCLETLARNSMLTDMRTAARNTAQDNVIDNTYNAELVISLLERVCQR